MTAIKPVTARQKLQPDKLQLPQLELMGDDIDLTDLFLTLNTSEVNIREAVSDINIERTIEGASTVTVDVLDRDFALLRSGRLSARNDIKIDGLWFRLVQLSLNGFMLTLTFEDRPLSILRTYDKPIKQSLKTSRQQLTRAQFVLRMIKEVKEFPIPYVIPELTKTQPISGMKMLPTATAKATNKGFGIPKVNDLKVKTGNMTEPQRNIANTILDVGASLVLPRSHLVMAIMCAIQESTLANLLMGRPGDYNFITPDPNGNPVGVFQQIPKFWAGRGGASRDVASDAHAFYGALVTAAKGGGQYQNIIESVQHSGNPAGYASWRTEAERIVNVYGVTSTDAAVANNQWANQKKNNAYEFYRGIPPTTVTRRQKYNDQWGREDSWSCIQRLASEVNWRAFFVSGTFYFLAEDDLFRSQPIAVIDHSTEGVNDISPADYDEGKKTAQVTLSVEMARWAAPPGSVIQLQNMGPWNGRWLVNDVQRSIFSRTGTIVLKKPMPRLPEPSDTNIVKTPGQSTTWANTAFTTDPVSKRQYHVGTALVQPVPKGFNASLVQGAHSTVGLSGKHFSYFPGTWPNLDAADFGGDAGAPVVAVESGTIVHLSGHDPSQGAVDPRLGVHGPFGWSLYLKGDSGAEYYYTHMGKRNVTEGQKVVAGQVLGSIGNYAAIGGVNHVHVGVNPGPNGRPDITDLMNAPLAVK